MDIGHAAKVLVTGTPTLITGGKPGARAGADRLAIRNSRLAAPDNIHVTSDAFAAGQAIPSEYSADGNKVSPALQWSGVPSAAKSLALIVEDPDAPLPEPFMHWLAWNISPQTSSLPKAVPAENEVTNPPMAQGKNSQLKIGFAGAAPPKRDDPHHYHFQLFALDTVLEVKPGAGRSELLPAMAGHVIARGELVGTFRR